MPLPISKSQADKLGQRLAAPAPHDEEDVVQLEQILITYAGVVAEARQTLDVLESEGFRNVSITGRAKTTQTTLEKIARNKSRLSSIEDLAGVRIVADMTLTEQDILVARVCDLFGGPDCCRLIDRRADPRAGYRAVHVVTKLDGLPLEIQVRTRYQDAWANLFEETADGFGRGIRYGEPANPTPDAELDARIAEIVNNTISISDVLYKAEQMADQVPEHDEQRRSLDIILDALTAAISLMTEAKAHLRLMTDAGA
jgi:ppGpp synthetase/RelA/SpoT-type nucleotidyltranferase